MTKQEAAARLRVSERTLAYWMAKKWLDIRYLSRNRVYITEESVEFWLKPRRKTPAAKNLPWKQNPGPGGEKPLFAAGLAAEPIPIERPQQNGRAEPQQAPDNNSSHEPDDVSGTRAAVGPAAPEGPDANTC